MLLKDKIVLITGASAGIGKACARQFAQSGAHVILAARRLERIKDLSAQLAEECDVRTFPLHLDVQDLKSVQSALASLPEDFRKINILVNNAGLASGMDPIQSADYKDWDRMIDTNIKGLLNMTREVIPGMLARQSGHIINIGSIAGRQVYPMGGVYCATKHAVRALTQGLLIDLLGTSIRVSTVDPGLVETEFSVVRFEGDTQRAKEVYQGLTPLSGADVAEAVVFCASRPAHVNIAEVVLLPKDQASVYHVHRA